MEDYFKKYIKSRKLYFAFFVLFIPFLSGIFSFIYYPVLENVINSFVDQEGNLFLICFLAAFIAVNLLLSFISNLFSNYFYAGLQERVRNTLADKLWTGKASATCGIPQDEYMEINKNIPKAKDWISARISIMMSLILFAAGSVYITVSVSFLMLLVEIGLILAMFLVNVACKPLTDKQRKVFEQEKKSISFIQNVYDSLEIVKSYFMEKKMETGIAGISKNIAGLELKKLDYQNIITILQQFINCGIMVLVPCISATLSGKNVGSSIISMFMFFFLTRQVMNVMTKLSVLKQSESAISSLDRVMALEDDTKDAAHGIEIPIKEELSLKEVEIGYGKDQFHKRITCKFVPGVPNVMVGESGSGKSTLIKTLLGILPVKSGNCFADGREIDISELHHLISYIPQEEYYIKNEGAFYNCQLADETITEERLEVEYEKVFQNHNYFWKDAGNINMLSGGQKETIGILRGLFCNAPVIIMDEPTKSLNVQNRQKLINEINRLSKRSMVIISTHDQEIIQSAGNIINLS